MGLTLKDYLEALEGKRIAVVGLGVSNLPLLRLLRDEGIAVTGRDRRSREEFGPLADELEGLGARLVLGETYLDNLNQDVIFRSPGIRPDLPEFRKAVRKGSVLTSEMELFFQVCPCRIIAVTGSDGKTTTATLIAEMLKAAGRTVHLGGNIGKPLLTDVPRMSVTDVAVLELSSFQLMTMRQSPPICVMTNLSPNHLDVHTSMEEYRRAKENIFRHQMGNDIAVFNLDNEETLALSQFARGRCRMFSRRQAVVQGVYVEDGMIYRAEPHGVKPLFPVDDIALPGEHNVENYLAAIAAVEDLVSVSAMQQVAREFRGVPHRIELVGTVGGVRYYNDSIATSPSRTTAALHAFSEPVILIAGGYDKGIPFDELGVLICERAKAVILNGHTAEAIRAAILAAKAEKTPAIHMTKDFNEAVERANELAAKGDVVLLSPACASFDQFPNFAARGDAFREHVRALPTVGRALAQLSNLPGPSGFENTLAHEAVTLLGELMPEAWIDRFGNAVAVKRCGREKAKALLLDAHLDEIGLIVSDRKDGFLRVRAIGGVDPRILPNQKVTVWGRGPYPGLVCTLPPHLQGGAEQEKSVAIADLWIDVGLDGAAAEAAIPVGSPVTFDSQYEALQNGHAAGKALDDRAGFVALLHAARLLKDAALDVDLYLMGSTREEVSGAGAAVATFALAPDCCIAVDVTHGRTPDGPKDETYELGGGPVIGIGPNMTRWVTRRLQKTAEERGISVQSEVMSGHSGTNAWRMQVSREGIPTGVLSIPLRYMHTPYEVVKLSDIEETGALLAAFAKGLDAEGEWLP